jgi:hypothetical protein
MTSGGPSLVKPVLSGSKWKVYHIGTEWKEDRKRHLDGPQRIKEVIYLAFQPARPLRVEGECQGIRDYLP